MHKLRIGFVCLIAGLIGAQQANAASASSASSREGPSKVVVSGAITRGGAIPGSRIIHVTTLADSGKGSLRSALSHNGPRVIVFDVSGAIELGSDLLISKPNATIAGQTAPTPGIELRGARLRIAASNVVVQHISVRPRPSNDQRVSSNRDALTVTECSACDRTMRDIRIENVSASWATDEIVGLWGKDMARITVRNSILAEALQNAGHKKGNHSMGLLVGGGVEAVDITGNLFAHNQNRNPVIGAGASAFVANNFIYDPGERAVHVYADKFDRATRATIVGNVVLVGPSSDPQMTAVTAPLPKSAKAARQSIYSRGNVICPFANSPRSCARNTGSISNGRAEGTNAAQRPVISSAWDERDAGEVWKLVSAHSGARPGERSLVDTRILGHVREGTGRIVDSPDEVGGFTELKGTIAVAAVPKHPFQTFEGENLTRVEVWLCQKHFDIGGPPTKECPQRTRSLKLALPKKTEPSN